MKQVTSFESKRLLLCLREIILESRVQQLSLLAGQGVRRLHVMSYEQNQNSVSISTVRYIQGKSSCLFYVEIPSSDCILSEPWWRAWGSFLFWTLSGNWRLFLFCLHLILCFHCLPPFWTKQILNAYKIFSFFFFFFLCYSFFFFSFCSVA